MKFADFALNHARGLLLSLVVLVALGLVAASQLPQSIYPNVAFARVVVVAENGEMAAAQMQQNITRPIEQAASSILFAQRIQSNSGQGAAAVSISFDPKSDINIDLQRVNAAISSLQSQLPPGTRVEAQQILPNLFPVLGYSIDARGRSIADTTVLANYQIKPALVGIKGVSFVRVVGGRQKEYWVSVNPVRLAAYGLTLETLENAIASANQITSVGHYNSFAQRQVVLVSGLLKTTEDVGSTIIANRKGVAVRVDAVATVHESLEPRTKLVSAQGREAVLLNIYAQPGANIVQIYHDVDQKIQEQRAALGVGGAITPYWNQAILVEHAVRNLRDAIAIGAILAIGIIWLFLGSLRTTLIAAAVIPLSIAISFFFMRLFNQGLNLMTLGGLAVGVGLVIVDAIFVVENIYRHLKEGQSRVAAVRTAMAEIAAPMIGSTITTIVVFAPMALLSGVTGAFFGALSVTLSVVLALSLLFALFITPLLASHFLRTPSPVSSSRTRRSMGDNIIAALLGAYGPVLRWFLNHRDIAWASAGAVMIVTALLGTKLGSDFMPQMDEGAFEFNFSMPAGTSLGETNRALVQVENILGANPYVVGYARLTGLDRSGFFPAPTNVGDIRATLVSRDQRRVRIEAIMDDIRASVSARVPILKFSITQILQDLLNDLSNTPSTIELKVFGPDPQTLNQLASRIDETIKRVPGVVDDFNGVVYTNPNTVIRINAAASQAGFTTESFTKAVEGGLNGTVVTSLPHLPVQIPVRVRYALPWRQSFGDLRDMPITAPNDQTYTVKALADVVPVGLATELNEENLRQITRVTANVSGRDLGSVVEDVKKKVAVIKLPPGYQIVYGGRYALERQSFNEFATAILLAILFVFLTMVFEFRNYTTPFVIITSVPLALFGVVIALRLTNIPLNVSSLMGLILLVGGVVKNGILYFDEVERLQGTGLATDEIMLAAGHVRLRPILMTTLTSMLGVLPLAMGIGAGSEMQKPLAVATIGGLTFSTFFTLLLMPAFYATFAKKSPRIRQLAEHIVTPAAEQLV